MACLLGIGEDGPAPTVHGAPDRGDQEPEDVIRAGGSRRSEIGPIVRYTSAASKSMHRESGPRFLARSSRRSIP